MKEIKMPYSEYEDLLNKIKDYEKIISDFEKEEKVVLIKYRYPCREWRISIPELICGEDSVINYLKIEFDSLYDQYQNLHKSFTENQQTPLKPTNKWWQR